MLTNCDEPAVKAKLDETASEALLKAVLEAAAGSSLALRVVPDASHLELAGVSPVAGRPNRALMKVFPIGPRRFAAFFYKRSQIPFSRDRFAYGAVIVEEGRLDPAAAEVWFAWLDTGFNPERTPPNLKRAFAFTVPD
jgi:hypothetical protein